MAYVISSDCVSCGACAEGDGKYEIKADDCIDCGTCAGTCPTGAISQAD